ncbi:hypothetical protein BJ741DRAFT_588020 [Chytriomyces cf. hyalinus JEL632]|nr:hypothetical protein BJ741DRAFT_588020 [Chytriomyces cf. hyalinus JEL632]
MNASYSDSEVEWQLEKPVKIKQKTAQKRPAATLSSMIPRARKKNANTAVTANSKISVVKSADAATRKHMHSRTDCDAVVAATPSNVKLRCKPTNTRIQVSTKHQPSLKQSKTSNTQPDAKQVQNTQPVRPGLSSASLIIHGRESFQFRTPFYRDEDVEFGESESDSEDSTVTNVAREDQRTVLSRTTPRCKRVQIENERIAAVKIQALFKMHRVRAGYVARKHACRVIQSRWRRLCKLRSAACVTIQRFLRGAIERRKYERLKAAAVAIQCALRRKQLLLQTAVLDIQRTWRGHCVRKAMKRVHQIRFASACVIQNRWREYQSALESKKCRVLAVVKIQSWWRMYLAASKHQKLKNAVNRIKTLFKQRKQKLLLQEKLAKLAKIQSRKRILLEKRRIAAMSNESSPDEVKNDEFNRDSDDSKPSQCVARFLGPQQNSPCLNESRESNFKSSRLPEEQMISIITPLAINSPAENSANLEAPTGETSAQRRASRASPVTPAIPKKELAGAKSKSKAQAKPIFCHLDALSAKELDRLTMANTSKHNGHVAVTIKTEIVQMDMERPPSPGLEPSRNLIEAQAIESKDVHYGLDPKRKTRIQWNPSIRQEFPLEPAATTNEPTSHANAEPLPKKSNLKEKPQILKVMQIRRQTVVVKRLRYVEPHAQEEVEFETLGFDERFQDVGSSGAGTSRVFVNKRGSGGGGLKRKKGAAEDGENNEERGKKGPGRVATVSHVEGAKKKGKRV